MYDRFNREITYLRISVTDRCNLRCRYCMGPEGVKLIPHEQVMRYEEITDFVKVAVTMGINKVRLTGGEPLVRKGIVSLVEQLSRIKEIQDFAMTTNGTLLDEFAEQPLKVLDPSQVKQIDAALGGWFTGEKGQSTTAAQINGMAVQFPGSILFTRTGLV